MTPAARTSTERDMRLGQGGLLLAITLSVAAAVVGTGAWGDFYMGAAIGAAITLVPAAFFAINAKSRPFASGMLAGAVVALGIEIVLVFAFVASL